MVAWFTTLFVSIFRGLCFYRNVTFLTLIEDGSYASQMSEHELWQVDHYVMKLKAALEGKEERPFQSDEDNELTFEKLEVEEGASSQTESNETE